MFGFFKEGKKGVAPPPGDDGAVFAGEMLPDYKSFEEANKAAEQKFNELGFKVGDRVEIETEYGRKVGEVEDFIMLDYNTFGKTPYELMRVVYEGEGTKSFLIEDFKKGYVKKIPN